METETDTKLDARMERRRNTKKILSEMKIENKGYVKYKFYKNSLAVLKEGEALYVRVIYPPREWNNSWQNKVIISYSFKGIPLVGQLGLFDEGVDFVLTKSMYDTFKDRMPEIKVGDILKFAVNPKGYGPLGTHNYYFIGLVQLSDIPAEETTDAEKKYNDLPSEDEDFTNDEIADLV